MQILGIDPGKTGALALLCGTELEWVRKMPVDAYELADVIRRFPLDKLENYRDGDIRFRVVVEKVNAGGGQKEGRQMAPRASFSFGRGFGVIEGILAALQIPAELVTPMKWTGAMSLRNKDKNEKWAAAKRLFPGVKIAKYQADSVLLAEYGRRILWPVESEK